MGTKKLNKELIKKLESENEDLELEALDAIRKDGFADYLPILSDMYIRVDNIEVKDKISALFQDLKDPEGVSVIIDLLINTTSPKLKSMLLTACWSSSLDFSSYIEEFVEVAVEGEYMLIFEVLTVIENLEYTPPKEKIERAYKRVESLVNEMHGTEGEMMYQLKDVLQSFE